MTDTFLSDLLDRVEQLKDEFLKDELQTTTVRIKSMTVTPTMHYYNVQHAEASCVAFRKHRDQLHKLMRVSIADENKK